MTEPTEIRLSLADLLAEIALGAMAREVEMDEGDEYVCPSHPSAVTTALRSP